MTRTETIDYALKEIEGLWPSTVREPEIRKRVIGKLNLAFNRGRFYEVITSLLENEPRRPENIINAISKHMGIVHGGTVKQRGKDFTLSEIQWEKHRNSPAAKMFRRICKCVKDTGKKRSVPYGNTRYQVVMTVDKEKLLDCYEEMLESPGKFKMSELDEIFLKKWVYGEIA